MNLRVFLLTFAAVMAVLASRAAGAEIVRPVGVNLAASYAVSAATLAAGDTLTVTRLLTNNTASPLTGLYLSDNLPPGAQIVAVAMTVNNSPVAPTTGSSPLGAVLAGCIPYYWTVSPQGVTSIPAGQTLRLEIRVVFAAPGLYTFPHHTAVGMIGAGPVFAYGDAVTVTVSSSADTTPPAAIFDLQAD